MSQWSKQAETDFTNCVLIKQLEEFTSLLIKTFTGNWVIFGCIWEPIPSHSSSVKEIKIDNNFIRDLCEQSSVFNKYFWSIGPTLIYDIHHLIIGPSHFDYIEETEHRFDLKTTFQIKSDRPWQDPRSTFS